MQNRDSLANSVVCAFAHYCDTDRERKASEVMSPLFKLQILLEQNIHDLAKTNQHLDKRSSKCVRKLKVEKETKGKEI